MARKKAPTRHRPHLDAAIDVLAIARETRAIAVAGAESARRYAELAAASGAARAGSYRPMTPPICFKHGLDEAEFEDYFGSVHIDLRPYREGGAAADLNPTEVKALRDWLDGWLAENAPAEPEADESITMEN